jgi:hypothetical protein
MPSCNTEPNATPTLKRGPSSLKITHQKPTPYRDDDEDPPFSPATIPSILITPPYHPPSCTPLLTTLPVQPNQLTSPFLPDQTQALTLSLPSSHPSHPNSPCPDEKRIGFPPSIQLQLALYQATTTTGTPSLHSSKRSLSSIYRLRC